jgi:hypothetical protein
MARYSSPLGSHNIIVKIEIIASKDEGLITSRTCPENQANSRDRNKIIVDVDHEHHNTVYIII